MSPWISALRKRVELSRQSRHSVIFLPFFRWRYEPTARPSSIIPRSSSSSSAMPRISYSRKMSLLSIQSQYIATFQPLPAWFLTTDPLTSLLLCSRHSLALELLQGYCRGYGRGEETALLRTGSDPRRGGRSNARRH